MITLIVARARNGAIGRSGTIPWDVPEDLKFFQRETLGGALIMGRTTWESLPVKPLPRRYNIVVSSNPDVAEIVMPSIVQAVEHARAQGYQRIYGIGGARIYKELLPHAHRLLISEVDIHVPDADTFLPDIDLTTWYRLDTQVLRRAEPSCKMQEYVRMAVAF